MLTDPKGKELVELPLPSMIKKTLTNQFTIQALEEFVRRTNTKQGVLVELHPPRKGASAKWEWLSRLLKVDDNAVCATLLDGRYIDGILYARVKPHGPNKATLLEMMADQTVVLVPRAFIRASDDTLANLITFDVEIAEGIYYV